MDEILKQFTNIELLDRYGEFYRKSKHSTKKRENEKFLCLIQKEILRRMENEK